MSNNTIADELATRPALFNPNAERAMAFSKTCPQYVPTQLLCVEDQGEALLIKDESTRYGLGSFKALGGIYAVAQLLLEHVQEEGEKLGLDDLFSERVREFASTQTYVCASAGNHGMAVATGARLFGANARIYVSTEVPPSFAERLRERGAEACVSGANYEQSLEAANEDVKHSNAVLLADGSWEGYVYPPGLVMEGYTVLATELFDEFSASDQWPSDVYLQAGVGGMAAAVTIMIRRHWLVQPRIVVVEPDAADCLALSAAKGQLVEASGPVSSMGRLDCKAASMLAWDTLVRSNVEYAIITDEQAEAAVLALEALGLNTTPSGAAGLAALHQDRAEGRSVGKRPLIVMSEQAIG